MNPAQLQTRLISVIEKEIARYDHISEAGEHLIEKLCEQAAKRAAKQLHVDGDFISAADTQVVIITVIERYMPQVYDEGWTFQMIAESAFQRLTELTTRFRSEDRMKRQQLATLYTAAMKVNPENSLYTDEWRELLRLLGPVPENTSDRA